MSELARAAWVIARRDYVATVWSRSFLLFLIGPLLPILFGGLFGALSGGDREGAGPPPLSLAVSPADQSLLTAARTRIAGRLGGDWLPPLVAAPHPGSPVLSGGLDRPVLRGPRADVDALAGPVKLLVETALAMRAEPLPTATLSVVATEGAPRTNDRRTIARGAQFALFFVTILLAGMLISNLVEEKSSKVIEVLAAAVPIDAIFLGKLAGMLAVSLTGIVAWGSAAFLAGALVLPHGMVGTPALGWPLFVGLAVLYWVMLYLLLGALYLGIGAQAGSVREVQTLALPLTLGQLVFFGLGSAAVSDPDRPVALLAAVVPWSSPFAMIARAAQRFELWPHLLALAWQAVALLLVVRVAARLFRRTVLRSGAGPSRKTALLS